MADDIKKDQIDWEGEIEDDGRGGAFTVLSPGEYPFQVVKFERGRHTPKPDGKIGACNKAILTIEVGDAENQVTVTHNLYLHRNCEGMLSQFFKAIGQKKHGEKVRMDWSKVPGAIGKCKVAIRKWAKKDEKNLPPDKWTGESNEIKAFIDAGDAPAAPGGDTFPPAAGADEEKW